MSLGVSRKWIHCRLTVGVTVKLLSARLVWAVREASMCFIFGCGYYGQLVNIARNVDNTAPSVDIGGQHDAVGRIGGELCA